MTEFIDLFPRLYDEEQLLDTVRVPDVKMVILGKVLRKENCGSEALLDLYRASSNEDRQLIDVVLSHLSGLSLPEVTEVAEQRGWFIKPSALQPTPQNDARHISSAELLARLRERT